MSRELNGKTIIVTGAGSGIGRAAALACAAAGANVVVADYNEEGGKTTAADIEETGAKALFIRVDVSDEDQVANLVAQTVARFGRLDGAFNNAGIPPHNLPLTELTTDQWRRTQSINLDSMFFCIKYQIIAMLDTGGGAIVNTSSTLSRVAIPNSAEYCASKAGVAALTRGVAVDYGAKNIRVNSILPGVIRTPMVEAMTRDPQYAALLPALLASHPVGRLGLPDDIAEAAVWLLSDKSSFVTGAEFAIDGGYTAIG